MQIPSKKNKTKNIRIKTLDSPPFLYIQLNQHIGKPAIPVVEKGEKVKKFQLIAKADGYLSSNIHSPVSGTIKDIAPYKDISGTETKCIIIRNDFEETRLPDTFPEKENTAALSPEKLLDRIKEAGIVGEGGAMFPTHVKYDIKNKKINTFIINGTECEPYLTSDYSMMKKYTDKLFSGINTANKILHAENIYITIEEQNKDLLETFFNYINKKEYSSVRIKILPDDYPQGGELQVIQSVTGIELKKGSIPSDYGVIVSNASTVISVHNAIVLKEPLTERLITITGDNEKNQGNYLVKIGTPVKYILYTLGIKESESETYVSGGPMMGRAIVNTEGPLIKGFSGLLNFSIKHPAHYNCISCGYCEESCPMHLRPYKYEASYRKKDYKALKSYDIQDCIECGSCEYVCPSGIPLINIIKEEKSLLKN